MKTVNVRQLENDPSDALRMARKAPVVVVNRDRLEAMLRHLDKDGLLGEPGVRPAIATDLYKNDSVSLSRGAKIAGVPLEEFLVRVSRKGIPVVKGDATAVREDLKNLEAWRKRRPSSMRAR